MADLCSCISLIYLLNIQRETVIQGWLYINQISSINGGYTGEKGKGRNVWVGGPMTWGVRLGWWVRFCKDGGMRDGVGEKGEGGHAA